MDETPILEAQHNLVDLMNAKRRPHGATRDAILNNLNDNGYPKKPWKMLAEELGLSPAYMRQRLVQMRNKGQIPPHAAELARARTKALIRAVDQSSKTFLELIENAATLTPDQIKKAYSYIAMNSDYKDASIALDRLHKILTAQELGMGPPPITDPEELLDTAAQTLATLPPETYPEVIKRAHTYREDPVAPIRRAPFAKAPAPGKAHPAGGAGDAQR